MTNAEPIGRSGTSRIGGGGRTSGAGTESVGDPGIVRTRGVVDHATALKLGTLANQLLSGAIDVVLKA